MATAWRIGGSVGMESTMVSSWLAMLERYIITNVSPENLEWQMHQFLNTILRTERSVFFDKGKYNYIGTVYIIELTWTFYCCILRRWAGTCSVIYGLAALSQATLSPYTPHIAVPGWTTASSKARRPRSFHCSHVTQLTANDCGINKIPVVVTNTAPLTKEKDLNSSFKYSGSIHQTNKSCFI